MTEAQTFIVLGEVRGQGRPRACKRGRHAGVYKATVDREYEDNIRSQVINQNPMFIPAKVPIKMSLVFHMMRPQSHFNAKGEIKDKALGFMPVTKPDLDNCEKAIKDALNSVVWHDDCQVVEVQKKKVYGSVGRVEITVQALI